MPFDIYPAPPTGPHNVLANSVSPAPILITTERVGPDDTAEAGTTVTNNPTTMFIRVVLLSPVVPPKANQPTIKLQANTGPETEIIGDYGGPTPIPDGVNIDAADGIIHPPDANNVYLFKILVTITGRTWHIRIKNNDGAAHDFTWVVASSLAESRQPWIDAPTATISFDALTSQSPAPRLTITVPNKGTGPLTITDTVGANAGDPSFKVAVVPGAINPNGTGDLKIDFNPPGTVGETNAQYDIGSNDAAALLAAGHNKRVPLHGVARQLEIVLLLDASGSMGYTPNGPPEMVAADSDARWGKLKAAAKQFLDLLDTLAAGGGRFSIAVFPDFTVATYPGTPAQCPSAGTIFDMQPITPTNVATASGNLDTPPPTHAARKAEQDKGATPIGFGIGFTMGKLAASFGFFQGTDPAKSTDRRFLVLLTDGKHNCDFHPSYFYGVGDTSFKGKNIRVIGVAYGNPGSGFEVDWGLVQTIATQSNGTYLPSGADNAGLTLKKDFRAAITASLTLDPTTDPPGVLTPSKPEDRRQVTITPYDTKAAFVVSWETFDSERVSVSILTPTCELITPDSARTDKNITFHSHPTYVIFGFNNDYLRNAADPANPRYGAWRLIIRGNFQIIEVAAAVEQSEPYDYEVITESRLKLTLTSDHPAYFAGDTINLTATLTLDGKGVPKATTTVSLSAPGVGSDNWLAGNKITQAEFLKTKDRFATADITALGIKAFALNEKQVFFFDLPRSVQVAMKDEGDGRYTASFPNTTTPGTYEFHATSIGQTEDGVTFPREQRLKFEVGVRPLAAFTLFETVFRTQIEGNQIRRFADVRVTPRDPFGNVVLADPEFDPRIAITTTAGKFTNALTWNLDASYSQTIAYPAGVTPSIGLTVDGQPVVVPQPLPAVDRLRYVDRVVDFRMGGEATPGANKHRDPNAVLGDVTQKGPDVFVSLGALGSLTVAISRQLILASQGDDDITVFVHPDEEPRPYSVEVLPITLPIPILIPGLFHWVSLGTSPGVTQSFSLRKAGIKVCMAIRVRDKSGRTRTLFQGTDTPGVSLTGVGVKNITPFRGNADELIELIKRIIELLLRSHD